MLDTNYMGKGAAVRLVVETIRDQRSYSPPTDAHLKDVAVLLSALFGLDRHNGPRIDWEAVAEVWSAFGEHWEAECEGRWEAAREWEDIMNARALTLLEPVYTDWHGPIDKAWNEQEVAK